MYQGRCQASIEQTESLEKWLDGSGYVSRGVEKNAENLDRRGLCLKVSRSHQDGIEQHRNMNFQE